MTRGCLGLAIALGTMVLAFPPTVHAQAMPRHVDDLVSEVLVVIEEVKKDHEPRDADDDGEEATSRRTRARHGGILPFTRTVVNLFWKGLPVQRAPEDGEPPDNPVRVRIKPSAGGGQVRCMFTF